MRRYLGIGLVVLAVSACGGETSPPPPPPPTTPSVIETVVAQPKYVDVKTRCAEFISPDEVGAATHADATVGRDEGAYGCSYTLTRSDGNPAGRLTIALGLRPPPTKGLPVVVTSLSGNTAIEQRGNPGECDFWVVIDGSLPPGAAGAVLWVNVNLETDVDACRAAREVVEKSFARLPDA
jgi:hypothetical protein